MSLNNATRIYTSLPPNMARMVVDKEFEGYYLGCISSWQAAGFEIISVNSDSEIDALREYRHLLEFISNGTRESRTKIRTFIELIIQSGNRVAGITNADCLLLSYDKFVHRLLESAEGSIVLLERINLDSTSMRPTGRHCSGFDGFLFDTRFLENIKSCGEWLIGEPFWDYWFPLMVIGGGARLKAPAAPILLHVDHHHSWQMDVWRANGRKFAESLLPYAQNDAFPLEIAQLVGRVGSEGLSLERHVDKLSQATFEWLRSRAEAVALSEVGTHAELVSLLLLGLAGSKELEFRDQLERLKFKRWIGKRYSAARQAMRMSLKHQE